MEDRLIASCSKIGGLIAQGLSVLALVPALDVAAWPLRAGGLSLALIAILGREDTNRDLRDLEIAHPLPYEQDS